MQASGIFRTSLSVCALLLVASQLAMCGGPTGTACRVTDDCWNSDETESLGRCAPKEVACLEGRCRAACPPLCEVAGPAVNPCDDERRICNQSKSGAEGIASCAAAPLPCESADDCPLVIPRAEQGDWSCEAGFCRFPGFRYAWE